MNTSNNNAETDLDQIKKQIHCIISTTRDGSSYNDILKDYKDCFGKNLEDVAWRLGFNNGLHMMKHFNETCIIYKKDNQWFVKGVIKAETIGVQSLIARTKTKSKKKKASSVANKFQEKLIKTKRTKKGRVLTSNVMNSFTSHMKKPFQVENSNSFLNTSHISYASSMSKPELVVTKKNLNVLGYSKHLSTQVAPEPGFPTSKPKPRGIYIPPFQRLHNVNPQSQLMNYQQQSIRPRMMIPQQPSSPRIVPEPHRPRRFVFETKSSVQKPGFYELNRNVLEQRLSSSEETPKNTIKPRIKRFVYNTGKASDTITIDSGLSSSALSTISNHRQRYTPPSRSAPWVKTSNNNDENYKNKKEEMNLDDIFAAFDRFELKSLQENYQLI